MDLGRNGAFLDAQGQCKVGWEYVRWAAVTITESEDGPWKTSDIDVIRGIPHNGSLHDVHRVRDKFLGCWLSVVSERAWARFHRIHVVGYPSEPGRLTYTSNPPVCQMVGTIRGKTRQLWVHRYANRFLFTQIHSGCPVLVVGGSPPAPCLFAA